MHDLHPAQEASIFQLRGSACEHTLVWPLPHRPVQLGWTCQECETPTDIALGVIKARSLASTPQTCSAWLDLPGVQDSQWYSSGGHWGTQAITPLQGDGGEFTNTAKTLGLELRDIIQSLWSTFVHDYAGFFPSLMDQWFELTKKLKQKQFQLDQT